MAWETGRGGAKGVDVDSAQEEWLD